MSQNRFQSIALYATAGIGFLLALVALLFVVEQKRTQAETGAVLSAFFSQVVLHDMDKWDSGRTITVVAMRYPDCFMGSVDGITTVSLSISASAVGPIAKGRDSPER